MTVAQGGTAHGTESRHHRTLSQDRTAPGSPRLRLRMLPDPHPINLHRGGRTNVTSGRIDKDDEHRRGSDAGGHAPDIDAVIVIGDLSRLPIRGESMPAVRVIPAGAADPYPAGII